MSVLAVLIALGYATAMSKKQSGPSGEHRQKQCPIREERPGQIDTWRAAARSDGRTLVSWIRWTLDGAAERARVLALDSMGGPERERGGQ